MFWHHQSTRISQLVCLASSGWLLSWAWKELKLFQVCWARPSNSWAEISQYCSLCLLQLCLSILTQPTEKLTAQPPAAWGNTCHAHFGKLGQGDCSSKGWGEGGLAVPTSHVCNMQPSSTWDSGKGWKQEKIQWVLCSKLQAGHNCFVFVFF